MSRYYIFCRDNGDNLQAGFLLHYENLNYSVYDQNRRPTSFKMIPKDYVEEISQQQFLLLLQIKVEDRLEMKKSDQYQFLSQIRPYDRVLIQNNNRQQIQGQFVGWEGINKFSVTYHDDRNQRKNVEVPLWNVVSSSQITAGSSTYAQVVNEPPESVGLSQSFQLPIFVMNPLTSINEDKPFINAHADNGDFIVDWTIHDNNRLVFTTDQHPSVDVADVHIVRNGWELTPLEITSTAEQFLLKHAKKQSEKKQRATAPFVFKDILYTLQPQLSRCVLGTPVYCKEIDGWAIFRWVGRHGDEDCIVVEHECSDNYSHNDGLFYGQRLWHARPGCSCVLIYDIDSIELHKDKYTLPKTAESCRLNSSHVPDHLGCTVHVKDKRGEQHVAKLLWTGRISDAEAVLVQLNNKNAPTNSFQQLTNEPWKFYWWFDGENPILLLRPDVLRCLGDCDKTIGEQSTEVNSQLSSSFVNVSFSGNESFSAPQGYFPLHDDMTPLGIAVLVQIQNEKFPRRAHLVWIGTGGNQAVAGVELDEPMDKTLSKTKFWIPITTNPPVCVLKKQIFLTTESKKDKWPNNVTYDELDVKIGTHVDVGQGNDVVACVLWTGHYDTMDVVIVKLVDNLYKNYDRINLEPRLFCQYEHVPGFCGPTIMVKKSDIRQLKQNYLIPTNHHVIANHPRIGEQIQFSVSTASVVHHINGEVRLVLNIDNQLYFAVVASFSLRQKSENPLFRAFAADKLITEGGNLSSWQNLFIISEQEAKPIRQSQDLPDNIKPRGLHTHASMAFLLDGKVFDGEVKWTGKWKGRWLVGLQVRGNLSCPNLIADPQLKEAIYCPPQYSLVFVEPSCVFMRIDDVPYVKWFFEKLNKCDDDGDLRINYHVDVTVTRSGYTFLTHGVCRYVGKLTDSEECYVGVELYEDQLMRDNVSSNGTFPDENGVKLFECPSGCGVIVPQKRIKIPNYSVIIGDNNCFADKSSIKVYCNVPHDAKFMNELLTQQKPVKDLGFDIGSPVEVDICTVGNTNFCRQTGKCVYIGIHKETKQCYIGVELDYEINCVAVTDGTFPQHKGARLFRCSDHKGVLLPKEQVQLDQQYKQIQQNIQSRNEFGLQESTEFKQQETIKFNSIDNQRGSHSSVDGVVEEIMQTSENVLNAELIAKNQDEIKNNDDEDHGEEPNKHDNKSTQQQKVNSVTNDVVDGQVRAVQTSNNNESQQNTSELKENIANNPVDTENQENKGLSTVQQTNSSQENKLTSDSQSASLPTNQSSQSDVQMPEKVDDVKEKDNVVATNESAKCVNSAEGEKPAPNIFNAQSANKITDRVIQVTDSTNGAQMSTNISQTEKNTPSSACSNEPPLTLSQCLSSRTLSFGCNSNATLVQLGSLVHLSDSRQAVVCWFGVDELQECYVGVEVKDESPNPNDDICTQKWKSITKNRCQLMFLKDVQGWETSSMSSQSYVVMDCGLIIGSHVQVRHESMEFIGCLLWTGVDKYIDKQKWAAVKLRHDQGMQEYDNPFDETFVCSHKYVPGFTGRVVIVSVDKLKTCNQGFTFGVAQFNGALLGTNVWVKNAQRTLCWIGKDEHNQVVVGVEQDQNKQSKKNENTDYPWHSITQRSCELVSLTEDVQLDAKPVHMSDYQLEDRGFVIGSHVQVKLNKKVSFLGCLLWTGSMKMKNGKKRFCVVVKAVDDSVSLREANVEDGRNVCSHRDVPGFYGPLLLINEEMISAFDQNFLIPSDKNVLPMPPYEREEVFINDDRGEIRLAIRIDTELYHAVVVKNKPQQPAIEYPLFKEFAARKIELRRNEHVWFVHQKDVEFVISEQKDIPQDLQPPLFKMNGEMMAKVEGPVEKGLSKDCQRKSKDYRGLVKWTGTIDRKWFVGLEVKKKRFVSCPTVKRYPQLKQKFSCSAGTWPVFVEVELVRAVTEQDLFKVFFGVPHTEKFFESVEDDFDDRDLAVGWYVQVSLNKDSCQIVEGISRWLGRQLVTNNRYVGIELNSLVKGGTNGMFPKNKGKQLFLCPSKCGIVISRDQVFVPSFSIVSDRYGMQKPGMKKFCEVPHDVAFIKKLTSQERPPEEWKFGLGFAVEVNLSDSNSQYRPKGVCSYIGQHNGTKEYFIGVELDNEIYSEGATSGTFPRQNGIKLFQCGDHKGILLPWLRVQLDSRLVQAQLEMEQKVATLNSKHKQKEIRWKNNPSKLIATPSYINKFLGDNGIQGKLNSCYMDATLFAMFAFNDTFDSILTQHEDDSINLDDPLNLLNHAIVNVIRRHAYVPQVNMKKFRLKFEAMTGSKGMTEDQKDPEEFLSFLFEKLCKTSSFLHYADGDNAHLLQLFFECDGLPPVLSVDSMINASFEMMMNTKFSEAPVNLILQIPRENGSYVGFKMVALDLSLDLHKWLSQDCFSECFNCKNKSAVSFCSVCYKTLCEQCGRNTFVCKHSQQKKKKIYELELYAVLCIEVSHYVTFVRIPEQSKKGKYRWIFFDSMGKREGDINLPLCEDLEKTSDKVNDDWILSFYKNSGAKNPRISPRNLPSQQQRLVSNAYTLFYRNPRLSVYD